MRFKFNGCSFFLVLSGLGLFLVLLLHPEEELNQDADEAD